MVSNGVWVWDWLSLLELKVVSMESIGSKNRFYPKTKDFRRWHRENQKEKTVWVWVIFHVCLSSLSLIYSRKEINFCKSIHIFALNINKQYFFIYNKKIYSIFYRKKDIIKCFYLFHRRRRRSLHFDLDSICCGFIICILFLLYFFYLVYILV